MKRCPSCQTENSDSSTYCASCGAKLPEAAENTTDNSGKTAEQWYYVEDGNTKGPFDKDAFLGLIAQQTVTPETFVWTRGMEKWTRLQNTSLYTSTPENADSSLSSISPEDDDIETTHLDESGADPADSAAQSASFGSDSQKSVPFHTDSAPQGSTGSSGSPYPGGNAGNDSAAQEWYYAQNGRPFGPYSEAVMASYISQGILGADSLVWREDFPDWVRLDSTALAVHLSSARTSGPVHAGTPIMGFGAVPTRSVIGYLLLSVVTCGIWSLVWLYQTAEDVNILSRKNGLPEGPSPIAVVLLSLVTCGLYRIYYFWTVSDKIAKISKDEQNASVLVVILSFVGLSIISLMIIQTQINEIVERERSPRF